jgi:putative transposase
MVNTKQIEFNLYNPDGDVRISTRNLPHWFQPGVSVYLTLRFLDSLPSSAIRRIEDEIRDWLWRTDIARNKNSAIPRFRWHDRKKFYSSLNADIKKAVQNQVSKQVNIELDKCHGECWFRRTEVAKIMADVLHFHNGDRYDLDSFVIMPNHVHVLFQFRGEHCFETIKPSWLRYSARLINKFLGRRGPLWQPEPFDHLVRNADQFEAIQRYIEQNPQRANLRDSEYLYWCRS